MGVRELFDRCARSYDADRKKLVPGIDRFYGTVARVIVVNGWIPKRILDLGAGTGLLTAMLAEAFPDAEFTLTDIAEQMLLVARERFAGNPRVKFRIMNHTDLDDRPEFDAVVSALSIHHLTDEAKRSLYSNIHSCLHPGGVFINADQVRGPSQIDEACYEAVWLTDAKNAGATPEAIAQARERMLADINAPLLAQLDWLRGAGFERVDCWYKDFRFAVFGGIKPDPSNPNMR